MTYCKRCGRELTCTTELNYGLCWICLEEVAIGSTPPDWVLGNEVIL